jgi:hypothetical protein
MTNATRKLAQAGATRAASAADLARFEPITPVARHKVDELISRGAIVVAVRATLVTLRRGAQTARAATGGASTGSTEVVSRRVNLLRRTRPAFRCVPRPIQSIDA